MKTYLKRLITFNEIGTLKRKDNEELFIVFDAYDYYIKNNFEKNVEIDGQHAWIDNTLWEEIFTNTEYDYKQISELLCYLINRDYDLNIKYSRIAYEK